MPDQLPPERSSGHQTIQPSHDANAFGQFRRGRHQASRQEVPRLPPVVLYGTLIALAAAIGFACAPWVSYELGDGTTVTESGIRSDGLVLDLAVQIAICALVIAGHREPGAASFPALIGLGACVIGLLAVGYKMMDPGFVVVESEPNPVPLARGWGLICSFLLMLVATGGAFRLWRIADHL